MIGRSVVVGVDGSAEARDAVIFGRRVTEAAGGRLHLVAAAEELSIEVAALRARLPLELVQEAMISSARERAVASLEGVLERLEVEQALSVRVGRPEHVLTEAGRERGADLFVLGGRAHRGPGSWLDRGTAHHLLRAGERPVVVTNPSGDSVERVLAAVDLSFATEPTLSVARRLARLLDVPLSVLHVVRWPDFPRGVRLDLEIDPPGPELERAAEHELRAMIPSSLPLTVLRGEVVPLIRRVVEEASPTLLVLGAQGRGWIDRLLLGSTTEALLAELPCSLAIVPSSPDSSASPG
jgi:nucleotide-binding universal stress UspA family protein